MGKSPAPQAPATAPNKFPLVTSFTVVKRDGQFHAIALRSRGREILDEKVLDTCEWLDATVDRAELTAKDFWLFGVDPFAVEEE